MWMLCADVKTLQIQMVNSAISQSFTSHPNLKSNQATPVTMKMKPIRMSYPPDIFLVVMAMGSGAGATVPMVWSQVKLRRFPERCHFS